MANPIGNVLVGNRHRGFTKPIGRMSLNESIKPIGRMGFKHSTFADFTSSLPAHTSGRKGDWAIQNPNPEVTLMAKKAGFASSLPAQGTTYSGKGWA
jgi:hypothetical protein